MASCIVVDDDPDVINLFCDMLSIIEMNVLATANDGRHAVTMYKIHQPDIVFTDLNMPRYDGLYAIEKIKDINADAKIIVVTGDSNAYQYPFLNSLDVQVIRKPFVIQTIKKAITDCLTGNSEPASFDIKYRFKGETKSYSCTVNYEQYKNFKALPIVEKCEIIKKNKKQFDKYAHEMRKAINMAIRNDTSHIRRLSEIA
ncbi:MAG: response regulator [Nitrosarchaeum sp.]|nr:response regulator [Nitrosarchaeum sp.]